MPRASFIADTLKRVWRETGAAGIGRRGLRQALLGVSGAAQARAEQLLTREEGKRLGRRQWEQVQANRDLRGVHAGKPAYVLATGPSIREFDLEPLRGHLTFGMNSLFRHEIVAAGWQPTYYFFLDDFFFDAHEDCDGFHRDVRAALPRSTFFAPAKFAPRIEERGWLPAERTRYFAVGGNVSEHTAHEIDFSRVVPAMQNVLPLAIAMAMYMGASPIYVLGADHDFLARPIPYRGWDVPHFHDGFAVRHDFLSQELSPRYLQIMRECERLWRMHAFLLETAKQGGLEIYNCTKGSFLDVYPERSYADALAS